MIWCLLCCLTVYVQAQPNNTMQQTKKKELTILLSGASFASVDNGWFELGCEALHAKGINRAIGGEAIADAANRMSRGELYSKQELEEVDVFVIMQVHNHDVYNQNGFKKDYRDYFLPFTRDNYAAAFDYVIKKYLSDCYQLQFDKKSKYYGMKGGKPATIVLCTHWHDARVTYNESIRKLSSKWGFPLIKMDETIGFSKEMVHPETQQQTSILYADDQETIDGVVYGWHPNRGKDQYIQQRMAAVFVDVMKSLNL